MQMAKPPLIEWRGVARSGSLETLIRRESARLTAWSNSSKVWKVTLEAPDPPRSSQDPACVRIEVRGPGRQMIVNRAHADAGIAVRDAFSDLFRKLERRVLRDRRAYPTRVKEALAA
jgi:hypothetical protein